MTHVSIYVVERRQVDKNLIIIRDPQIGAGTSTGLNVFRIELLDRAAGAFHGDRSTQGGVPQSASAGQELREICGRSSVYTPGTPTCPWTLAWVPKVVTSTST